MNEYFGGFLATFGSTCRLPEILRVNPPLHYWETHAGSDFLSTNRKPTTPTWRPPFPGPRS